MEHQIAELNAIACAICKPELASLAYEYVNDADAKSILYALTGLSGQVEVPVASLTQLTGLSKRVLAKYYEAILDIPTDDVESVFDTAVAELKEVYTFHKRSALADTLALKIKAGKFDEAFKVFEEITSTSTHKAFEDITTDIISSMETTNGFYCGIKPLDEEGGLYKSNLFTLFGDTGSMKTMISIWLCIKILMENPTFTCLYFEKEMPKADVARRLFSFATKDPLKQIMEIALMSKKGLYGASMQAGIETVMSKDTPEINAIKRISIVDCNKFETATDMRKIITKHKPDIWCLDYVSLLSSPGQDANSGVTEMLKQLKDIVQKTETFGILLSQIKHNTIETRANKVPVMSDIEWGSQVRQFSSHVYATFRPFRYFPQSVPRDYYYLVNRKSRNSSGSNIFLHSRPEICSFEESKADSMVDMENWLNGYLSKHR